MGYRSKRLQIYGVGVPWGQRPTSSPGGAITEVAIRASNWLGIASTNAFTASPPGVISRTLTPSTWDGVARANSMIALAPGWIVRPLTPSEWHGHAEGNAITVEGVQDVAADQTGSAWFGNAAPSALVIAEVSCCGRMYEPKQSCRVYEPICCVED